MWLKNYFYRIFVPNISAEYFSQIFVQYGGKQIYKEEFFGIFVKIGNYTHIYFNVRTYVMVLGHSPLSRLVAWWQLSSPIRLGYWRYASTHPLNALQMVAPRAAI